MRIVPLSNRNLLKSQPQNSKKCVLLRGLKTSIQNWTVSNLGMVAL